MKASVENNFFCVLRLACAIRKNALMIAALSGLVIIIGCATNQSVRLPAVASNPGGDVHAGKFVWVDLLTEDVPAASDFYNRLFGWRSAPSEEDDEYFLFYKGAKPVAGMVAVDNRDTQAPESLWLLSLSVDDVDQSAALIEKHGGTVVEGPLDAAGRGRMALIEDPAGAPLILLRASGGDPMDSSAASGEWFWTDLFTKDAQKAGTFYRTVAGYQVKRVKVGEDHHYNLFKRDGKLRAGMVELQWEDLEDNWLPYFKVDDVAAMIERAGKLGGQLVLEVDDVAILADPTGAVFGIQMQ